MALAEVASSSRPSRGCSCSPRCACCYEHWQRVEERDRRRAAEILKRSKGLPHKMNQKERRDLVDIAKRVDHIALGRDLASAATPFPTPGLKSKPPKG